MSARGYRAYIAAYLIASLEGEEAPDLVEYVLFSLHPLSSEARDAAIRSWLDHFVAESTLAAKVMAYWS